MPPAGYWLGRASAYDISELILPSNCPPAGVGRWAMSRGKLTIVVAPVVGSMLTTIKVSLRACVRMALESIPVRRMLIRCGAMSPLGVAVAGGAVSPGASESARARVRRPRRVRVRDADEDVLARVIERQGEAGGPGVGDDHDRGEGDERCGRDRAPPAPARTRRAEGFGHRHEAPDPEQDDEDDDRQGRRWREQLDHEVLDAPECLDGNDGQHDDQREAEDQRRPARTEVELTKTWPEE